MKKILGIILCFALMFCLHSNVSADIYKGSISALAGFETDGSLVASDAWSGASLSWTVDDETNQGYWTYAYEFTAGADPELSHAIIELSSNFTPSNIIFPGTTPVPPELGEDNPKTHDTSAGEIWGLKWEFGAPGLTATFTLVSDKSPMWGDFYAKGGQEYAYNSGFGFDPPPTTAIGDGNAELPDVGAWVLVPDTGNSVPEPGTMFLLGSGLIGIGVFARRKFKR
jgi:hypothetical protein